MRSYTIEMTQTDTALIRHNVQLFKWLRSENAFLLDCIVSSSNAAVDEMENLLVENIYS